MGTEDENNNSEYQFIKETIKERPVNKKKVLTRIIMILISALLFGAVSAGVFMFTVRQFMNGRDDSPDPVNIPMDEEPVSATEEVTEEETESTSENEAPTEAASEEEETDPGEVSGRAPTEIISYNVTEHVTLSIDDYKSF